MESNAGVVQAAATPKSIQTVGFSFVTQERRLEHSGLQAALHGIIRQCDAVDGRPWRGLLEPMERQPNAECELSES